MEQGLKYTLCFIRRSDEVLMLNREKPSWMGMWNGVGGRIEQGETPRECILREVLEETGIKLSDALYGGVVTWEDDGKDFGGMHIFLADVPKNYDYKTPRGTNEGILDWKRLDWLLDPENTGVIKNIQRFLPAMLEGREGKVRYHCIYEGHNLKDFQKI